MKFPSRGLYAITDTALTPGPRLLQAVGAALCGGAVAVQYRDKSGDRTRRRAEARALAVFCRAHDVPLLINDDVTLAGECGADGVHLGGGDMALDTARRLLGPAAIIGVSCYNELARVERAAAEGADYVALGSFFPSPTKPQARRAVPALLREAQRRVAVPVVAIGGITADNGTQLVRAGADLLAVISDLFGAEDIEEAARRIANLF